MKARYSETTFHEVELTDAVVRGLAVEIILKDGGLKDCHLNDKGQIVQSIERSGGSHSWDENTVLRCATINDRARFRIIKLLRASECTPYR